MRELIWLGAFAFLAATAIADDKPTTAEATLIAEIEKLDGKAKILTELDESARVMATFEKGSDELMAKLAKKPGLGAIDVRDAGKITDKGWLALRDLPKLQRLLLSRGTFTANDATAIAKLKSLTTLSIGGCKSTEGAVGWLKNAKSLKVLDVMDSKIGDKTLDHLLSLADLEELNLSGTNVTDAALAKIVAHEKLKHVQLNNTKVTRAGLDKIEEGLKASGRKLKIEW